MDRAACIRALHSAKYRWNKLLSKDILALMHAHKYYPDMHRLKACRNIIEPLKGALVARIAELEASPLEPPNNVLFNWRLMAWQVCFPCGRQYAVFRSSSRDPKLWPCMQLDAVVAEPEVLDAFFATGDASVSEDMTGVHRAAVADGISDADYVATTTCPEAHPLVVPNPPAAKRRKKLHKRAG